jgi:hypothetical protein
VEGEQQADEKTMIVERADASVAERVRRLLEGSVPESVELDYKRDYPLSGDKSRREFIKDVGAFANGVGGTLIYGIDARRDDNGQPTDLPGDIVGVAFPGANSDQAKYAILSSATQSFAPKIRGVATHVATIDGKRLLVVEVPRSLEAPHSALGDLSGRFYKRTSSSSEPMDVEDLRRMFLRRNAWDAEIEEFRQSRVQKFLHRQVDYEFPVNAFTLVHVLPVGRLDARLDVYQQSNPTLVSRFVPSDGTFLPGGQSHRGSLYGPMVLAHTREATEEILTLFHNGGIEYATSRLHASRQIQGEPTDLYFFDWLKKLVPTLLSWYVATARATLSVDPPYAVALTIAGAEQRTFIEDSRSFPRPSPVRFLEPNMYVPALTIESVESAVDVGKELVRIVGHAVGEMR